MHTGRFDAIASRYPDLKLAVVGDFSLDRYLEIDPARKETSIETGLPVYNVVKVRSQPGAAGTILSNLTALGIGQIYPIGFCGEDGEGFELRRALQIESGVNLDYFITTDQRHTFTYCKPLVVEIDRPPAELNRLDRKNWTPTPSCLEARFIEALKEVASKVDGIVVMEQVDLPETGVITSRFLRALADVATSHPDLLILADSRQTLANYPPVCFKMNQAELAALANLPTTVSPAEIEKAAVELARQQGQPVFVTLAENGIIGASPDSSSVHVRVLPLRGEIDIVGAGDAVTANLTAALAAGASVEEAVTIANTAASIVIHQLGTTGRADVPGIAQLLKRKG